MSKLHSWHLGIARKTRVSSGWCFLVQTCPRTAPFMWEKQILGTANETRKKLNANYVVIIHLTALFFWNYRYVFQRNAFFIPLIFLLISTAFTKICFLVSHNHASIPLYLALGLSLRTREEGFDPWLIRRRKKAFIQHQ